MNEKQQVLDRFSYIITSYPNEHKSDKILDFKEF